VLVGCAISLFYLLLLSLSEHIPFVVAYSIASVATIVVIGGYVKAVFKNMRMVFVLGGLLVALYAFLYVALTLEDYALLVGSIGIFIILAIVMYVSRKVNWYAN